MKIARLILKWVLGIIISLVVLLGIGTYLLNTKKVQNWLLQQATAGLSDKLDTRVVADSVSVNLFKLQMSLYGMSVDDLQGRELFGVLRLDGRISLKSLGEMKIIINSIEADSIRANLSKERPDSAANYQFIIDALKKDNKNEEYDEKGKEKKIRIDFQHLHLCSTSISYQDSALVARGNLPMLDFNHDGERYGLRIDSLTVKTNRRSGSSQASPGIFDIFHADLLANVKCSVNLIDSDSITALIDNIDIREKHSGIDLHDLHLKFASGKRTIHLGDLNITEGKAKVSLGSADLRLLAGSSWENPIKVKASVKDLYAIDDRGSELAKIKSLDGTVRLTGISPLQITGIESVEVSGVKATIAKDSSGRSNYGFITDLARRFPKKAKSGSVPSKSGAVPSKKTAKSAVPDKTSKPPFTLGKAKLSDLRLALKNSGKSINVAVKSVDVDLSNAQNSHVVVKDTRLDLSSGGKTTLASVASLNLSGSKSNLSGSLSGVNLKTDNHKPRKNEGKPKRGWFDAGHLDLTASMKIHASISSDGNINAHVSNGSLKDATSGIDISGLTLDAFYAGKNLKASNISLKQKSTTLNISHANITLPDRQSGGGLSYSASGISGTVVLADISRAFAPVLKDFKIPLKLNAQMSGTAKAMEFTGVSVSTSDQRLTVSANGRITHLGEKHQTVVSFNVNRMHAKASIIEPIISQFPVKKLMMSELHRLGDITYIGKFDVFFKRVDFNGNLTTNAGLMGVGLTIDSNGHWLTGKVSTNALRVGKVLEMEKIGDVNFNATFKIDISKERTAKMRREKGGKLPIGEVSVRVNDCSYGGVHLRNLEVNINSDGATGNGNVLNEGKRMDLSCEFTFTNSEHLGSNIKVRKPKVEFHKKNTDPEAEKAKEQRKKEKAEAKEQKKQEKAEANALKAQEKAEAKAKKEQEKAEAKAKKEQEKAEKAGTKAQKKADKAEAKSKQDESGADQNGTDDTSKKKKKKIFGLF